MSYDATERLKNHFDEMLGKSAPRASFIEILRLTRLIIEQNGLRKKYPVLTLYCDWVQHTNIHKNSQAWDILESVNDALVAHSGNPDFLVTDVSRAFSLTELRREMKDLYTRKRIRTDILDSLGNWKDGFLGALFDDLCNRPIEFQDDIATNLKAPGRAVFDRMIKRATLTLSGMPLTPMAIFVSHSSATNPGARPQMTWNIRLIKAPKTMTVTGLFVFSETLSDFSSP